jgi:hypothetical protein
MGSSETSRISEEKNRDCMLLEKFCIPAVDNL